ncbi:hypothetical protein SGGMMB4_05855 (plasmid) [Sodalis glossinidius str. 'morsitans']|uniref:Uncharacterized protein n=1 Tax=Sodalis glossinidius (strain morsitans) TaxID=343509 RepID=A0A193QNZ4_SODGM|nr:hypothetical protein SGGMMB4_05855 [Sodalis glossinidius str. 'morsitans']
MRRVVRSVTSDSVHLNLSGHYHRRIDSDLTDVLHGALTLKQLATVNEYNGNTYLSIKNGIKGKVEEKFNGYSLEIEGLTRLC